MTIWSEQDVTLASEVLAHWQAVRKGTPLRSVPFAAAQETECHDNAAAYVRAYGGEVVAGFLVEHAADADWVYVRAHSVIRQDGDPIDPTLSPEQLRNQAFFEHIYSPEMFQLNVRRWAQIPVSITVSDSGIPQGSQSG